MTIEKLIAVSGKPGLYEMVSGGKKNVIVQSLADGKRFPISAVSNISTLDSIAIYTFTEEVPLSDVFYTIFQKEEGKATISHKESGKVLTSFFTEILPEYDTERVYTSNIKKVIQWYNILVDKGFDFTALEPKNEDENDEAGEE
ncbi:MAG TPA: hypothetical protein EYG92_01975 [Lutibacter sp.]|nr:hypothetical protein [Lutibacter sp.]